MGRGLNLVGSERGSVNGSWHHNGNERVLVVQISRLVTLSSAIAHALAWAVYLPLAIGFVVWPTLRGGHGEEPKVLITMFMPVALTGLGLLAVRINSLQGAWIKSHFWHWLPCFWCSVALESSLSANSTYHWSLSLLQGVSLARFR